MDDSYDSLATAVADRSGRVLVPAVSLSVIEGPDAGLRVAVENGGARVGTAPTNELCLHDPMVSRFHAQLTVTRRSIRLRDLGSTNGTFVGDLLVRDVDVPPNACVKLGATVLRVEPGPEATELELFPAAHLGALVGGSVAMRRLFALIERAARGDATVLIEGETGTGKELVAQVLHERSTRASGPFVAVDCGAIPESLAESELFGHVRGAFTGALGDRKGVFEEAHGGTLFLDEIGELALPVQRKLLRVLESREVRRVGSTAPRPVSVRVIAATNRNLPRAVNEGLFRDDLFYRLAVVRLELPPLRARREDIPLLAQHLFEGLVGKGTRLPQRVAASLVGRDWPGNVRELRNAIESQVHLGLIEGCGPPRDDPSLPLPPEVEALVPLHLPFKEARDLWNDRFETTYVRALLARTDGNVTRAAELGGVSRRFLQRLMVRAGIRDEA